MFGRIRSFLSELSRRRVYRVAVAYAAVSFVVWQACEIAFPALGLPDWSIRLVVVLTLAGFPVSLVLAWAYDVTPQGIVRADVEEGVQPERLRDEERPRGARLPTSDPGAPNPGTAQFDPRRLAILPLANIHPDRDEDYFADGMTEELISVVSRIQGLDVIARTSVMAYRDTTKSVAEIGRDLNVGTVLEGSVRKAGDQLRITVQLVDTATQGHLWSRDYDRELREVFKVQSDIARNVADALEVTLLGAEERRIDRAPTDNLEAYDHYLLGRHHLNMRTDVGLRTAIAHFETAVDLDPGFAPALAGLADVYTLAAIGYAAIPEAISRARGAAEQALDLDAELPDAHAALGYVALNAGWDWQTAEQELGRAIELNPSDARAYQWYAQVALYRLYLDEAAIRYDRALELDPLSVVIQNESGWPAFYGLDLDKAMARFRKAASMEPSFAMAHFNIGNCHEAAGRLGDAVTCYRKAAELSSRVPFILSFLASALARTGRRDEALGILEELRARQDQGAALSLWLAVVHEALGQTDDALHELERALEQGEPAVPAIRTPWIPLRTLHDEPRFQRVLAEVQESMDQNRRATIEASDDRPSSITQP